MLHYIKNLNLKVEEELTDWLTANDLSYNDFEKMVLSEIKLKEYCTNNFGSNIESRFMERKPQVTINHTHTHTLVSDLLRSGRQFINYRCVQGL